MMYSWSKGALSTGVQYLNLRGVLDQATNETLNDHRLPEYSKCC